MAAEKNTADDLDDLAFQLFSARVAANPGRRAAEQEAAESYRLADSFLAVRRKVRSGELKPAAKPTGPQLADCCCPNQPRNHPHNLVAREFLDKRTGAVVAGDLVKINRVQQWLTGNPTPLTEDGDVEIVGRFTREFPELNWTLAEINIARAVFPHYCRN